MVKRISFLILSAVILVIGIIAISKLDYLGRSARIFTFSSDSPPQGRMGKDRGSRGEFAGQETHNLPEDRNERFGPVDEKDGHRKGDRKSADSLRTGFEHRDRGQELAGSVRGGRRNGEGRGGGDFGQGKTINLKNVYMFLAVFALFTVAAIYCDKGRIRLIRKRAKQDH